MAVDEVKAWAELIDRFDEKLDIPGLPRFPKLAHERWIRTLGSATKDCSSQDTNRNRSCNSSYVEDESANRLDYESILQEKKENNSHSWDELCESSVKKFLKHPRISPENDTPNAVVLPKLYITDNQEREYSHVYDYIYDHRYSFKSPTFIAEPEYLYNCLRLSLIGVPSALFQWSEKLQRYECDKFVRTERTNEKSLGSFIEPILEAATRFQRLELLCQQLCPARKNAFGVISSSLGSCLRVYLQYFRSLVILLYPKRMPAHFSFLSFRYLTRKFELQLQFLCVMFRIDDLSCNIENASSCLPRGLELLAYLCSFLEKTGGSSNRLLAQIVKECMGPYLKFLQGWAFEGQNFDPFEEFGIQVNEESERIRTEEYWGKGVCLSLDNKRLNLEGYSGGVLFKLLKSAFFCGKGMRLLRILQPRHHLLQVYSGIPKLILFFDQEQNKVVEKDIAAYFEKMLNKRKFLQEVKENIRQMKLQKQKKMRASMHAKLVELDEEMKRVNEGKKFFLHEKKRNLLLELKSNAEAAEERRMKSVAEEKLENEKFVSGFFFESTPEYEKLKAEVIEQIEREYSELEKVAERKARVAEWKLKRFMLNDSRNSLFEKPVEERYLLNNLTETPLPLSWNSNNSDFPVDQFPLVDPLQSAKTPDEPHEVLNDSSHSVQNNITNEPLDFPNESNTPEVAMRTEGVSGILETESSNNRTEVLPLPISSSQDLVISNSNSESVSTTSKNINENWNLDDFLSTLEDELNGLDFLDFEESGEQNQEYRKEAIPVLFWFAESIDRCILQNVRNQLHLVNCSLYDTLMEEFNIFSHFTSLHQYLLMGAGDFCEVLCGKLCELLDTQSDLKSVFSPVLLNEILTCSLELSCKSEDENSERLSISGFCANDIPSVSAHDLSALDSINLSYAVEWPLNVVITDSSMQNYSTIFSFLLRLKRAAWIVRDIRSFTEDSRLRNVRGVMDTKSFGRMRHLQMFRYEIQHFVQVTNDYVFRQIMLIWQEFAKSFKVKVHNIDEQRNLHDLCLSKIINRCMLSEAARPVKKVLDGLLSLICKFRTQVLYRTDNKSAVFPWSEETYKSMLNTRRLFSEYTKFLFTVINKLVTKGYQPHLEEFLVNLNFNFYYGIKETPTLPAE
eukprot:Nk52_evm47s352 gene=Nk52_evmTU47s352